VGGEVTIRSRDSATAIRRAASGCRDLSIPFSAVSYPATQRRLWNSRPSHMAITVSVMPTTSQRQTSKSSWPAERGITLWSPSFLPPQHYNSRSLRPCLMILKAADLVWRVAELQPGARGCFQGYKLPRRLRRVEAVHDSKRILSWITQSSFNPIAFTTGDQ
jgi:hypothetical protein